MRQQSPTFSSLPLWQQQNLSLSLSKQSFSQSTAVYSSLQQSFSISLRNLQSPSLSRVKIFLHLHFSLLSLCLLVITHTHTSHHTHHNKLIRMFSLPLVLFLSPSPFLFPLSLPFSYHTHTHHITHITIRLCSIIANSHVLSPSSSFSFSRLGNKAVLPPRGVAWGL